MYTLGSSGIKQLQNAYPAGDLAAAFADKLIAWVGTPADRVTPPTGMAPLLINGTCVYIEVPAAPGQPYSIANPITTATVYPPLFRSGAWVWGTPVTTPINATDILENIVSGSGWTTLYTMMRGNYADIANLPYQMDGLPFWCRDQQKLYIYNDRLPGWEPLSSSSIPVGSMVRWSEQLPTVPGGYLRANGAEVPISAWPDLYAVYGAVFGAATNPANFMLPMEHNSIIKAVL
jgi:hypothetical protein